MAMPAITPKSQNNLTGKFTEPGPFVNFLITVLYQNLFSLDLTVIV